MAAAVGTFLLIGVLVAILIGGALLILNLGLMSKRKEDRIGGVAPSDLGILRETIWPEQARKRQALPVREEEELETTDYTNFEDTEVSPEFGDRSSPQAGTAGVPQSESPTLSEVQEAIRKKRVA